MQSDIKYASFGQRLLARFIDSIIMVVVSTILSLMFKNPELQQGLGILLFCFLYQPVLESEGGTWGKKIVGIKTISLKTNAAPTIGNSYSRSGLYFLFFLLLIIPALISCLAVLWSDKKQTWHDSATDIVVIGN